MKIRSIFSVLLAILLVFCFSGCAAEEEEFTSSVEPIEHSLDILAYAQKGEIPEVPFKLGDDVDNLKETFLDHIESGSEIYELGVMEGEETVHLLGGSMTFCYQKDKKENGISVIVAQEYAYDFAMGVQYIDDVIFAVGSDDYQRASTTEEDAFFLPVVPENSECLTYTVNNYQLKFIFTDNVISAVSLIDTENWDN